MNSIVLPTLAASELLSVNLLSSIRDSDLVGWLCLLALLFISLYQWALIRGKSRQLNQVRRENNAFRRACENDDGSLDAAFAETSRFKESPLALIFHSAYMELYTQNWFRDYPELSLDQRLGMGRQFLERAVDKSITEEVAVLEKRMIHLGTVSTVCPFIGLFGTVWGVLAAFQSLAGGGAADISALAPGISTALITTIAGLIPAISAVIMFNYFQSQIQMLIAEMESYSYELQAIFQTNLIERNQMRAVA